VFVLLVFVAEFYVLSTVHPCIILKIKPTCCTIFLSMFNSFLNMSLATMCLSSGKISVSMRHLVFVTLKQVDSFKLQELISSCNFKLSTCFRVANTKCRIDTDISPDDEHIVARHMLRKEINILRKILHQVRFIYKKAIYFASYLQSHIFD
jgi:hypothetical protein